MSSDSYLSPDFILKLVEGYYDPCPYNDTPEINGLNLEWPDKTFCNPPYSNPLPWVEKAIEESKKGKFIVMLLKCDTSTKAYFKLHQAGAHILLFNGRLKYKKKEWSYDGKVALTFPSMLVILNGI